ncbi:glycosyltransferase family 39 protein [Gordonia sp. TBRC 11910]|uniref:Glycosyltransferase family 39 protein n=1 Tax=Gordonia asplenii TaxID=2725283 RepID=A0A848KVJ7_9ACTN|nr:glycosyltransferase family 39 protein [Gordonia asplenii]NMO00895.1 glycosyltransferase family 39 protein [Gordonia asplenii]
MTTVASTSALDADDHPDSPTAPAAAGESASNTRTGWWTTQLAHRGSLAALLVATTIAYLWNLSANGWGNSFYAAAIQAGSQSAKAWFFGSSDMANSITVDKPPASLWIPALSVRIFGLNSWAMLVPEALMGVGSVALLYFLTRRYFGHWPAILAGGVLAMTPVAALMFRFNNPEALLILLMIGAVWALLRAVDDGRTRWLVLCGVFVGFGFLTKQMAVLLIVPGLAVTYLAFGPHGWGRRLVQLFAALGGLIVSAGWWILAVELWPASSRPYIGGSPTNSILELTFGYNGLGRINGDEHGSVGPGAHSGGFGGYGGPGGFGGGHFNPFGEPSPWRMFEAGQGGQIAWLIPAALVLTVAGIILLRKASRRDGQRAFLVVWALWLLVTAGVFSFMQGIFHSYYTAALAPAVAALVGGGAALIWRNRAELWVRIVAAGTVWATAGWAFALLDRSPDFVPWLRWAVLVVGIVAGLAFLPNKRVVALVAATAAIIAGLAGPLAYTLDTLGTAKSGAIIGAGPNVQGAMGGPFGGMGRHGRGGPGGMHGFGGMNGTGGMNGMNGPGGMNGMNGSHRSVPGMNGSTMPSTPGGNGNGNGGPGTNMSSTPGGAGGLLWGSTPTATMIATLNQNADHYTWVAAAVGSMTASGYQLATNHSVMPIGGFNGTDPSPTLAAFKELVAQKKIHFFIASGRDGFMGNSDSSRTSAQISDWIEATFGSKTVDGITLYDLSAPKGS